MPAHQKLFQKCNRLGVDALDFYPANYSQWASATADYIHHRVDKLIIRLLRNRPKSILFILAHRRSAKSGLISRLISTPKPRNALPAPAHFRALKRVFSLPADSILRFVETLTNRGHVIDEQTLLSYSLLARSAICWALRL